MLTRTREQYYLLYDFSCLRFAQLLNSKKCDGIGKGFEFCIILSLELLLKKISGLIAQLLGLVNFFFLTKFLSIYSDHYLVWQMPGQLLDKFGKKMSGH